MSAALKSGAAYFAIVFLAGFLLGTLRTLVVAPALGATIAVLIEAPIILGVSWLATSWCVAHFKIPATPLPRAVMGLTAFVLLMMAELGLSTLVFRLSVTQHLAGYGSDAGIIGLSAQVAFAGIPLMQTWRRWPGLAVVRALHTAIYLVMATSTFIVLYAGVTGATGAWLWIALGLVATESAVFVGNGLKCPLTAIAVNLGAGDGDLFDTFLPERITRYTFRVFGPLIVLGVAMLAVRWALAGPH